MSIERDYLMRQMMMLFDVLQKVLRLRKKGDKEEAEKEIKYFYECLKVDQDFEEMNISEMVQLLEGKLKLTNEHIEMIAFVLKEQGELADDEDKRLDFFRKSYYLLDKVERESTVFSMDRQMKLAWLREYVN